MPSLALKDRKQMLVEQSFCCPKCGERPYKNYCRSCDEFFLVCHCLPEPNKSSVYKTDHRECRAYSMFRVYQYQTDVLAQAECPIRAGEYMVQRFIKSIWAWRNIEGPFDTLEYAIAVKENIEARDR